jgi:LAGLIDADG endonuclease
MTDCELAWVAGFLEGEGTFGCNARTSKENPGLPFPRVQMTADSTDEDVIRHLHQLADGRVAGPYNTGHKPVWRWRLSRKAEIKVLCTALLPLMGRRRARQVTLILTAIEATEGLAWARRRQKAAMAAGA